jgi:magnesium-transporting ATPase (P-type)
MGLAARAVGLPRRSVWSRPGRYHIEVHGVDRIGAERLARQVERSLAQLPGVAWARVNAPSGRVVVAVRPPEPRLADLIAVVAAVERTHGSEPAVEEAAPHPPAEGPRTGRALSTLAADAVGLGLSALTRIVPFAPVPGEVAGLATIVDLHPRLRALAARGLHGRQRADSVLPLVESVVQGLTGGWTGIVLDGALRAAQWGEARAQLAAWAAGEERLAGTPERAAAPCIAVERPRPKPDGQVERYVASVLAAGTVAGGLALPMAGFKRAVALTLAALPKAAVAGREGYAAELGRVLAKRGVIAMDRGVLRDLDRVDTLLLDEDALRSDRSILTDLVPLPDADPDEVAVRAFTLFDPADPAAEQRGDGWVLGPIERLDLRGRTGAQAARRLREGGAGSVLGLARGRWLAAVIKTEVEAPQGVDALAAAARRVGMRLVVAGTDGRRYGFADALVPGGSRLVASVRALQAEGAMVMLVSGHPRALSASDCGLGVSTRPDGPPPWGAHLLIGADLETAALIVDAAGTARAVIHQSIALARAGTGLGAISVFTSPPARLPNRVLATVNATAGLALAHGVWRAHRLPSRPPSPPVTSPPWHLMPAATVLARLGSTIEGLHTAEVRAGRDGADEAVNGVGLVRAFAEELANPLTPVLAAGAALSAAVGSPADAGLVAGVIGLSALIGAVQRVGTERSLAALLSRSAVAARVRRAGTEQIVAADELVPGDIIVVTAGDVVPADCRVLEVSGLEADESALTGESLPVAKTSAPVVAAAVADRRSMLYEGTTVAAGHGVAVVVATGTDTEAGRGIALARQAAPTTGVEARMARLTSMAIPLAAGSAAAVAGAGLLRGIPLTDTIATAANLAVASVPEGLPFLVSAAQLAAARRLAGHGALVRNPRTIEALGRVDVLCFDKTGTLTEGQLRLAGVGDGDGYSAADALDPRLGRILAAALRATPPARLPEQLAHQTDRAVLEGARQARVGSATGARGWRRVASLPFEPSRGYHATVGVCRGAFLLSVKGAPEMILPRCGRRGTPTGDVPLDQAGRDELRNLLERHAGAGHRVLAIAERQVGDATVTDADVQDLTFVGFITIADAVRGSAAAAVRGIHEAGVHTIMVTGDHPATAEAIASIIGTDDTRQRVTTGTELDQLDDDAVARLLADTDVVARCTPAHKVRIIQTLQRHGRTVAMTGDGANDAPAIRLADVGIALGHRATPAARAAADLVVTDDRLETIIAALVEGRAMWSSVRQALGTLIGGNLGEIVFSVLTAAATGRSALTARQLLLVNLLTDLAPALAIAVRRPRPDATDALLTEGPDSSLGDALTREIALRAASTALGATTGWTLARLTGRHRRAGTVALAALVGTQLGQTLLAGGVSPGILAATVGSAAVLAAIIQTPGVSQFFGCTPLGPLGWGIATTSAVGATLTNAALNRYLPGTPSTDGRPG